MKFIRLLGISLTLSLASGWMILSCTHKQKEKEVPEPTSPKKLVRTYTDLTPHLADLSYTDKLIEITLDSYEIHGDEIHWFGGLPGSEVSIKFIMVTKPHKETTGKICIIGRCKGKVFDGFNRGNGVDFYIRVENCSLAMP